MASARMKPSKKDIFRFSMMGFFACFVHLYNEKCTFIEVKPGADSNGWPSETSNMAAFVS